MPTDRPLWQKLYFQPVYTEVAKQVGCLESMLVYRGMDIPPDATRKTAKKPARKRTRKQPSKKS